MAPRATAAPLRWLAAVVSIVYGFAKLNGSQFTVLDSELSRPLGEVSGFWLTWYYFGYSGVYGTLIALLQIGGGILLVLPRTALAGALLLLPVFANIFLVDVFFGIDLGATLVALLVVICLLAVVAPHAARLREAVLLHSGGQRHLRRAAALSIVLAGAWSFTWWVANYNNRHPTPIDGVWSIVAQSEGQSASPWREVFFERNRAHWVVFRAADGREKRHHFEMDDQGIVRVWQTWLTKGDLIMEGRLNKRGQLELASVGTLPVVKVLLERRSAARRP